MSQRTVRRTDVGLEVEGWQTPPPYAAAGRTPRSTASTTAEAIPAARPSRCCRAKKRDPCRHEWVLTLSSAVLVLAVAAYGFLWVRGAPLNYGNLVGNLKSSTGAPIDSQVVHVAMDDVRCPVCPASVLPRLCCRVVLVCDAPRAGCHARRGAAGACSQAYL